MKYHYKDFATGRPRWTRGKFERWEQGGPLNAWGAVFFLPCSAIWVPAYCLSKETKAMLPPKPQEGA